jgi:hypothetical protein
LIIILLANLCIAAESNNILQNGSFELPVIPIDSNYIENPILPGWTVGNAYYVSYKSGGMTAIDGLKELYIFNGDIKQIPAAIRGGCSYLLQFYASANEILTAPANSYAIIEAIDGSNQLHELDRISFSDFILLPYQWYQSNINFTCPINSIYVGCGLQVRFHSGGMIHLDNIILKIISSDITIDDFEFYSNIQSLRNKWVDRNISGISGSTVSIEDDFADRYIGKQSMIFAYDNNDSAKGYYSQVEYDVLNSDFGGNWESLNLHKLCISFCGNKINDVNERIFLIIKDREGNDFEVRYPYSKSDFSDAKWHNWIIDIETFSHAGIDIANISKMYLGFDDSDLSNRGSTPGGKGVIYFDNIKLTNNPGSSNTPGGDITSDGKVNFKDMVLLGNWWSSGY